MKINRDKLECLAEMQGLNGKELAYKAGIYPSLLYRIKARGTCNYTTAKKIARVIGWGFIEQPTNRVDQETTARWQQEYEEHTADLKQKMEAVQAVCPAPVDALGEYESIILDFINKQVPTQWSRWSIKNRRMFWAGNGSTRTVDRDRICAAEVWCEALGRDLEHMGNRDAKSINDIIATVPGWCRTPSAMRFGPYGVCRGFVKR